MGYIFYAEDNPSDVWLLQDFFHRARIANALIIRESVPETVAYLQDNPPPLLLLLDLGLRGHDGLDILRWMRTVSGLGTVPVLVLTGSESESDRVRSHNFGALAFITKPIDIKNFSRATNQLNTLGWELVALDKGSE